MLIRVCKLNKCVFSQKNDPQRSATIRKLLSIDDLFAYFSQKRSPKIIYSKKIKKLLNIQFELLQSSKKNCTNCINTVDTNQEKLYNKNCTKINNTVDNK